MKITLLTIVSFISCSLLAQEPAFNSFYCNGVKGWSNSTGGIFQQPGNQKTGGGLIINPQNEYDLITTSINSVSPNIAGKVNGKLQGIFNSTNNLLSDPELQFVKIPGPLETLKDYYPGYNRFWSVRKWEIQALINDYKDNGIIDHEVTKNILTWPGRGNKYSREIDGISWPDRDLAPFYDSDHDGIYDPYAGDFPILDETCPFKIPSEMTWSIYHSRGTALEIQILMYGFASDYNVLLNNTIFSRIKVFNQNLVLKDAKFGLYYNFDLGCVLDDFIGTSAINNTIYVYNKSETDQSPCNVGNTKYNSITTKSPMQSITCLNRMMTGSIIYDNGDTNITNRDPNTGAGYYKYISTKWPNDEALTYGGNGLNHNSVLTTSYIYPDPPSDEDGWSMITAGNAMSDPRGFMNFNLDKMIKNQSIILDFAFAYHQGDVTTEHFSRVDSMLQDISQIQKFYNSCFDTDLLEKNCNQDCVWPGDTDNNGVVNNLDILNIGAYYNANGIKRSQYADWWSPFYVDEWSRMTPDNTNLSHVDCNGSGYITDNDFDIVKNNFFAANYSNTSWGGYNDEGKDLTFKLNSDSLNIGEEFVVEMSLGNPQTVDLFGIGFTVEYDDELLDYVQGILEVNWLDKKGGPLSIVKYEKGKIHFSVVKKSGSNSHARNVNLGRIKFKVKKQLEGRHFTTLKYSNYEKISAGGQISPLSSTPISFVIHDPNDKPENYTGLLLYPNPATEQVFIKNNKTFVEAILIDYLGKQTHLPIQNNSFVTSLIPNGAYVVRLKQNDGTTAIERLVVIK